MKNVLKDYRTWLISLAISTVSIGVPYLLFFLIKTKEPLQYPLLHLALAALLFLIGFIYGDVYLIIYKKKNDCWNEEVPIEKKESAWFRRMPFYISSLLTLTVFLVSFLFNLIAGHYPFL